VDGELALPPPDSVLVDLEYDPERSFVFVVGVMMPGGEVKQWFSENEKQEREAVEELIALWLEKHVHRLLFVLGGPTNA